MGSFHWKIQSEVRGKGKKKDDVREGHLLATGQEAATENGSQGVNGSWRVSRQTSPILLPNSSSIPRQNHGQCGWKGRIGKLITAAFCNALHFDLGANSSIEGKINHTQNKDVSKFKRQSQHPESKFGDFLKHKYNLDIQSLIEVGSCREKATEINKLSLTTSTSFNCMRPHNLQDSRAVLTTYTGLCSSTLKRLGDFFSSGEFQNVKE